MKSVVTPRFVNPFTDLGFKIIFGQFASKDLLITLLNELLAGEHHIEDLTFLDKEDHAENVRDKGIVYDLYCQTSTGEYIIVEMQNRSHSCFLDRTLYYMSRAISRQIESPLLPQDLISSGNVVEEPAVRYGMQYKLPTVYGIFLMNFKESGLDSDFRTDTWITSAQTGKVINPHFRQIYLQFPYFKKELSECNSLYERLMYTLKNMQYWSKMPDALKDQVFKRLEQLAAVANLSESDRIAYDRAVDSIRIGQIVEDDVREEGFKKGHQEGLQQGLQEGLQQGLQEGLQQGEKKGEKIGGEKKAIEIARRMKQEGMAVDVIARISGLSEEYIQRNL